MHLIVVSPNTNTWKSDHNNEIFIPKLSLKKLISTWIHDSFFTYLNIAINNNCTLIVNNRKCWINNYNSHLNERVPWWCGIVLVVCDCVFRRLDALKLIHYSLYVDLVVRVSEILIIIYCIRIETYKFSSKSIWLKKNCFGVSISSNKSVPYKNKHNKNTECKNEDTKIRKGKNLDVQKCEIQK